MRKLMKKKVNVFGKGIPVLAIFVLGIALVSAALVPYLSGLVTGSVIVNQPLELTTEGDLFPLGSMHGGETVVITFDMSNVADVEIDAIVKTVISSPGISVDDFTIWTTVSDGTWTTLPFDSLAPGENVLDNDGISLGPMIASVDIGVNGNELIILSPSQPWQAGKTWTFTSDITFATNALGDYSISVQMIPAE